MAGDTSGSFPGDYASDLVRDEELRMARGLATLTRAIFASRRWQQNQADETLRKTANETFEAWHEYRQTVSEGTAIRVHELFEEIDAMDLE